MMNIHIITLLLGLLFQRTAPVDVQTTVHFKITSDKNIPSETIQQMKDSLESTYSFYQKDLYLSAYRRISVRFLGNKSRYESTLKYTLFEFASFTDNTIYIHADLFQEDAKKIQFVLSRVVVHALTSQISGCPRWLGAAYSMYVGNEVHTFDAFAGKSFYDFSDMDEEFNRATSISEMKSVYSGLGSTIQFLTEQYGERKVKLLFSQMKKGSSLEQAFQTLFGLSLDEVQESWQRSASSRRK